MRRLLISPLVVIVAFLLALFSTNAAAEWPWPVHFLFPPQAGLNTACLTCGWHGSGRLGAKRGMAGSP
jgi:hypothetical protein